MYVCVIYGYVVGMYVYVMCLLELCLMCMYDMDAWKIDWWVSQLVKREIIIPQHTRLKTAYYTSAQCTYTGSSEGASGRGAV